MGILDALPYAFAILLAVVFFIQLVKRPWARRIARPAFFIAFIGATAWSVYVSYLQYQAFGAGPLGLTLRTVEGISWFTGYVRLHFWNTYLVSLIAAFLLIFIAQYFHNRRGKVFFEDEELYLAALGIFTVGYPGIFGYILSMLFLPAIAAALFLKKGERMPLYYFWMPVAIGVIVATELWAVDQSWWNSFRF